MCKRVLMVATVPSMIGQFNMDNLRILQELGYDVEIACNLEDRSVWTSERIQCFLKELEDRKIVYHQVSFTRNVYDWKAHIRAYKQLRDIVVHNHFRLIHCQTPIAGVIGRMVAHKYKMKVIYTAHGFHFYSGAPILNWLVFYPIEKFWAKWTDVLLVINKEDFVRAQSNFRAKKIEYIPGVGIDTEHFSSYVSRKSIREVLNIPESATVLLSVGELNENKNHRVVIEALTKVKEKNIYYVVCGQGTLKAQLENMAKKTGVCDRVRFTGFCADIEEYYKMADIFVFPSMREGLPVSLLEAMASGLPCVVSDIRGNRDLIEHERNGLFCYSNSGEEYAELLKRLFSNMPMRIELAEEAQKEAKKYDKSNIEQKMKSIYQI